MKSNSLNEMCQRYVQIRDQIKLLELQKEALASELKALGSAETAEFAVIVKEVEQNRTVGADKLIERLGEVKCIELQLVTHSTYVKLDVKCKIKESKVA